MRALIGRLGHFWYVVPCVAVLLVGLATCSLIDVADFDRFDVKASATDRTGARTAVLAHHYHVDSGSTVSCVWIIAGPAPASGQSRRLARDCAAVATSPTIPIRLSWRPNGRLLVTLPKETTVSPIEPSRENPCYFHAAKRPNHVCYRDEIIDIGRDT